MRIDLAQLDPTSRLAERIKAAMSRDMAAKASNLARGVYLALQESPSSRKQLLTADYPSKGQERECDIHAAVVGLLRSSASPGVFWTHFPAGEKRSEATGRKLARMGTKPGVPDFVLVVDGRALFLELKTATGKLSATQRQTHAALVRAGSEVAVVRSLEEATAKLRQWGAFA